MDEAAPVSEIEDWARQVGGFDDHHFFRSSGSSGEKKWIALSRAALEWSAEVVNAALGVTKDDVLGLALPEIHVGGYGLVVRAWVAGARLARYEGKWDAVRFTKWCEAEAVTVSSLVPTQVHDLVESGLQAPASLRVIVVGGGVFDEALKLRARAQGWPVLPSYGMTETSSQVATGDGLPLLPGWEAKVVDGRMALRGGGLLTAVIRETGDGLAAHDPKQGGWFVTSDLAEIHDGKLRILGRADRLVKVLGELVDLEALEDHWREKLGSEVAIVSHPDERRGLNLSLFYEGGPRAEEVAVWNAELPGPSRISGAEALESLPRSALGKIDRSRLNEIQQL